MRLRTILTLVLGIAILSALLYYIRAEDVVGILLGLNPFYLSIAFVSLLMYFVVRSIRWGMLLKTSQNPGFINTFSATGLGYFINVILPVRIGEFARALAISRKSGVDFMYALATVVIERVFDLIYLLAFLGLSAISFTGFYQVESVRYIMLVSGAVLLAAVSLIMLMLFKRDMAQRLLDAVLRFFMPRRASDRISRALASMGDGFAYSAKYVKSPLFHLYSLLITFFNVGCLMAIFYSTGLSMQAFSIMVGSTIMALSSIIPAPPGGIGVFELVWTGTFVALGLSYADAISSGVVSHIVLTTYLLLICGVATLMFGKDFRRYMQTNAKV